MPIPLLTAAIWGGLLIWPFWRITTRVGYPGWLSLLTVVPVVNLAYLYFLAYSTWPGVEEFQDQGRETRRRGPISPSL